MPHVSLFFRSRLRFTDVVCVFALLAACAPSHGAETRSMDPHRVDPLMEDWRWQRISNLGIGDVVLARAAPDGTIGLVSSSNNLRIYDGYQPHVVPFPEGWSIGNINAMAITSAGTYCLVASGAILLYDGETWTRVSDAGLSRRAQDSIIETADGILWAGVDGGIARIDPEAGTSEITPVPEAILCLSEGPSRESIWVSYSPDGSVWEYPLCGRGRIDEDNRVRRDGGLGSPVLRGTLLRAHDSRIWFINDNHNLPPRVFDPETDGWREINLSGIGGDNFNFSILETPDGAVWISSRGTLHVLRDGAWRVYHSPEFPVPGARSILVRNTDGHVSIIEQSGIHARVDYEQRQGWSFNGLHYQDEQDDGAVLFISTADEVVRWVAGESEAEFHAPTQTGLSTPGALLVHSNGDWILSGSHNRQAAVSIFDGDGWQRHLFPEVGLSFGHLALLERANGEVWLGCAQMDIEFPGYEGGVVVLSPDGGGGYSVSKRQPPDFAFRNWSMQAGPFGTTFTSGNGLYENTATGAVPVALPSEIGYKWIDQVAVDANGDIWCAVWSLGLFRRQRGEWIRHTEADGLGNVLTSFVFLLYGEVPVASTSEGHYRFDGQRWAPFMGNMAGLYRGSGRLTQGRSGSIWINHTHVDWYYRGQREEAYAEDKKRNFRTHQYVPDTQAPVTRWVAEPPELVRNTDLAFRWTGLDAWSRSRAEDLRFSHRVNGGEWSPFTPDTFLILGQLKGGENVLEVRARDSDFNVEATPLRAQFTVIVPIWQQAWFIGALLFGVVFFFAVVAVFIRQRIRHMLELEGVKMRFFTHLSHEIKTPLSLILGPVERLQNEISDGRHQHYLSLVKSNSQRLLFLVNQLLDFRKLQLKKLDFKPETGDFIPFTRSCLAVFNGWVAEKGQTLAFETRMRHLVFPFPHEIFHKIIDNLVNNAIKYTPHGGRITVRIDLQRGPDGRETGVLEVQDTGPGVPESERAAIFEPFYRSSAGEDSAEGSGIGLAFVKELTESIDGTVEIISPANRDDAEHPGSCFRVSFPVRRQSLPAGNSAPPADTGGEEVAAAPPPSAAVAGGLILLVEDNIELREFISGELSGLSRVEPADSMETGFRKAKELIPDIVVSDVVMQGRSGFDLCRDLKAEPHTSHIPVVLLTALRSEEHKRQAYASGADDFITKPVSPEILRLKLQNLLDTQQHSRQRVRQQFVDDNRVTGVTPADQAFLDRVRATVEAELGNEQFDVNFLAEKMGFSRSAFYRKFNSLTDLSPASFIRTKRLRQAAQWLAEGGKSVSEIAYDVGFSDAGYFSRVFKDQYKCSPSEFARRGDS